jgi:phosphoribosylanthranilate isomerase
MGPTKTPRVKICCINSVAEAELAVQYGASALGLVGPMPSGPGIIPDEKILEIARTIPPPVASFLLTCEVEAKKIIEHHQKTRTNTIQIVDKAAPDVYDEIKEALPAIRIVQVIHVMGEQSLDEAMALSKYVDALLLDSGNPNLAVKELGGTGRTHNWEISARIREQVNIPVFLAGGLTPENVRQAIETVRPFGVDVCSGLRTHGDLDEVKLKKFFAEIHQ